ncbi:MAG: hypothetical protein ACI30I_08330 [Parabacteroides sp.]
MSAHRQSEDGGDGAVGCLALLSGDRKRIFECSDPSLVKDAPMGAAVAHMRNFVDCIRSRRNPIAPVEVGCSTNIMCCLNNIAHELGRPVKWDPATLSFVDDEEAAKHRLYYYKYRNPYTLPYWDK